MRRARIILVVLNKLFPGPRGVTVRALSSPVHSVCAAGAGCVPGRPRERSEFLEAVAGRGEKVRPSQRKLTPARLLHLLAQFQVDLVDWSLEDAEWVHQQRQDERHPHFRMDAVQSVWLRELLDAGLPRGQLGEHFGVSRATLFRAAVL